MSARYDAIIIGAGIIGACTAFELAKRGWRTLNVDRLPAAGYGSTGSSCAIIRTHYSTLDGAALAWEGFFRWDDWAGYLGTADERGLARFHKTGCLVMKTEAQRFLAADLPPHGCARHPVGGLEPRADRRAAAVLRPAPLRPAQVQRRSGFRGPGEGPRLGGVFFPCAGYIGDPQLASHNAQRAAEAKGAAFRFNAEVVEIRKEGGRIAGVTLASGEVIDAPVVVNIAGPHSAKVNRLAGVRDMKIATRALKQEVAHVPFLKDFDFGVDGMVTSDGDIGCYCRPEVGNHIVIGTENPPCDRRDWVDPDDYDRNFTEQWQAQVERVAQRIPALGIPGHAKGAVDLYDVADDWIPIYDKSDIPGFYMAVGTSGNQFKNAPVAGAMMALLIEACEQGRDHDRDPLPFRLERAGHTISIGFFSRLREVNRESSFSVLG